MNEKITIKIYLENGKTEIRDVSFLELIPIASKYRYEYMLNACTRIFLFIFFINLDKP